MGCKRRNGAAVYMAKAAPEPVVAVLPHRHPSTARLDLQTGWPGGVWQRRRGVVRTSARVAHQLLAVALEQVIGMSRRSRTQLQCADASASSSGICGANRLSSSSAEKISSTCRVVE